MLNSILQSSSPDTRATGSFLPPPQPFRPSGLSSAGFVAPGSSTSSTGSNSSGVGLLDDEMGQPVAIAPTGSIRSCASAEGLATFYGHEAAIPASVNSSNTVPIVRATGFNPTGAPTSPAIMPTHAPKPPQTTSLDAVPSPHSATTTPRTSITGPSSTTSSGGLSPKTSKLLRRIQKREDELEELTLENELLKEANRRANEERSVREQEKRVEAKKRREWEEKKEREIEELRQQLGEARSQAVQVS
jgi:hypothetical protein